MKHLLFVKNWTVAIYKNVASELSVHIQRRTGGKLSKLLRWIMSTKCCGTNKKYETQNKHLLGRKYYIFYNHQFTGESPSNSHSQDFWHFLWDSWFPFIFLSLLIYFSVYLFKIKIFFLNRIDRIINERSNTRVFYKKTIFLDETQFFA